ncbi:MAG: hypothetical protein QW303_04595 [Nitrososphaerota archaeon]
MKNFLIVAYGFLFSFAIYSQEMKVPLPKEVQKAPEHVKLYYHVIDSLKHPTWQEKVEEKWTINDIKRYGFLLYECQDFDPIAKAKYNTQSGEERKRILRESNQSGLKKTQENTQWYISDRTIIEKVEKEISPVTAWLIKVPIWLTIEIDSVEKTIYQTPKTSPPPVTMYLAHSTIKRVWKGKIYKENNSITPYYMGGWIYPPMKKGETYIVGLSPIIRPWVPDEVLLAIGGPHNLNIFIYKIENGYVIDQNNKFLLGNKVEREKFETMLDGEIKKIKSWKGELKK